MNRRDACLTLVAGVAALALKGRTSMANEQPLIRISTAEAKPPVDGPADYSTGSVRISTPVEAPAPARVFGGTVAFAPGARTAWHTHPLGQTLIVTDGTGWVKRESEPPQAIKVGDVVWIPPDVKHWHGAAAGTAMTHVAIVEQLDGKNVTWMEKVSDSEYPR